MKLKTIQENPRRSRRRWFIASTMLLPVVLAAVILSNTYGGFLDHLTRFNLAAESKDNDLAEQELTALDYYYGLATKWRMQRLADKFFYKDTYLRKAIYTYLIGDYDKVVNDKNLQDRKDSHWVSQLIGSARFRKAKANYQKAKTSAERNKIIEMVMGEVCEDFRRAVENGPGPSVYFDHSFNFDLCSDANAVKKVLENPGPPRLILHYEPGPDPDIPNGDKSGGIQRIDQSKSRVGSGLKKKG